MTTTEETATATWQPNPTLTHRSLADYINERCDVEITAEQCQALLKYHGTWQKDPARIAEREQEKAEKAEAAAAEKAKRAEAAAAKKAAADAEKAKKDAAAAAKKAADANDDSDLDSVDPDTDEGDEDSDAAAPPVRRKPRIKASTGSEF